MNNKILKKVYSGSKKIAIKSPSININLGDKKDESDKKSEHDLIHTGVIGAIGAGTSYATSHILNGAKDAASHSKNRKAMVLGGALGLVGDYAGLKINKRIDKSLDKVANVYLEKIASSNQTNNKE